MMLWKKSKKRPEKFKIGTPKKDSHSNGNYPGGEHYRKQKYILQNQKGPTVA